MLITGREARCELESADGRISVGGTLDEVVESVVPLLQQLTGSGRTCAIVSELSLGWKRTDALKATGATCKVALQAASRRRRNSQPPSKGWQMPADPVSEPPSPVYKTWEEYLARTTKQERMKRCYAASKKANRKRLLSAAPTAKVTGPLVWAVIEKARGRCAHCGSLALEIRPSKVNGAPSPWAPVGRRIGSLEHSKARYEGGDNFIENLAWACLWCNTWPCERRVGAKDHGAL